MAARFVVRNSAGVITFDSDVATVGCVADVLIMGHLDGREVTYPLFVGRSAFVFTTSATGASDFVVDTDLGYPRVVCLVTGYPHTGVVIII